MAQAKPTSVLFTRSYALQRKLKRAVEEVLHLRVLRALPLGSNVHTDIAGCLPAFRLVSVLDVGANIGQTAAQFSFWHPGAKIYCVEPVRQNFEELKINTARIPGVECFQVGLGEAPGSAEMLLSGPSSTYRVTTGATQGGARTESVPIETVDQLCARLAIESLSYLKIDTEGHDLKVLKGAAEMLRGSRIDFIEVEAGMNPHNDLHVPLEQLKAFAEQHDYLLFGLYEQRHDWPTRRPILRRCNAVFIARRLAEAHRLPPA